MDKVKLESLLVSSEINIKQAMQRLSATAEKILFVVNSEGKLLGTVTDGDIRGKIIQGLELDAPLEEVINRNFKSISSDEPGVRKKAKELMLKHRIEQIPVLKEGVVADVILWIDLFGEKEEPAPLSNQVVIMAGGKGSRLDPFTKILPKPLIPIGDKPVIEIIMERFKGGGFNKFLYTLNYKKEYIKTFLKEGEWDYEIDWIEEEEFLGTAGSLSLLRDKITETFFVSNCDTILDADYGDILRWHKKHKGLITVVGCHKEVKIPYGILEMEDEELKGITEKPQYDVFINTGIYVLEPEVISFIDEEYMDMNTLIEKVSKSGKVSVYPVHDGWLDIGQWKEYKTSMGKFEEGL